MSTLYRPLMNSNNQIVELRDFFLHPSDDWVRTSNDSDLVYNIYRSLSILNGRSSEFIDSADSAVYDSGEDPDLFYSKEIESLILNMIYHERDSKIYAYWVILDYSEELRRLNNDPENNMFIYEYLWKSDGLLLYSNSENNEGIFVTSKDISENISRAITTWTKKITPGDWSYTVEDMDTGKIHKTGTRRIE